MIRDLYSLKRKNKHLLDSSGRLMNARAKLLFVFIYSIVAFPSCKESTLSERLIEKENRIAFIGNNLCSRMINYGHFETAMYLRNRNTNLLIRNMCDGGDTPGFRPHSGRKYPWAFEGADQFYDEESQPSGSQGHFETHDQWLTRFGADVVLAFFGYNESFNGKQGIDNFKEEMRAFIDHTLRQRYNRDQAPNLILISPLAFEDHSPVDDLPNGIEENKNLLLVTEAMKEVSVEKGISFINLFDASQKAYPKDTWFTIDGFQLNEEGNKWLGEYLAAKLTGIKNPDTRNIELIHEMVKEKNWYWHYDFKMPNGVHVFGRRYEPFGPDNYPSEIKKVREMTSIRDSAIWDACLGKRKDLESSDLLTTRIPEIETNYQEVPGSGNMKYLYGQDAINSFKLPDGYKIELFASEQEFPDLANPVQLSFDNEGRLWVAVMPSYPHYKPGDPKPDDKLIILEDTNSDGEADRQITWAEGLHLPIGFELSSEGVYLSQGTNLKLLTDTNGDDQADKEEVLLSGFDDHDTHHAISAFCSDPSGAIYMAEGVFLHSNVETPYGPVRATNGGFFRYNPSRHHLERTSQVSIPNPWGIAFDDWGQNFFAETSGPDVLWMMPGTIKPRYGISSPKSRNLIEEDHRVRPTSGLEFVSSRHFADHVQGDLLINNTIGFLGTKQHQVSESGTGYKTSFRQDLIQSSDPNFRPVDMEFAPDGSLYVVDWHNALIGHMQHNARDPLRDHVHGRIYRITYPSRPLIDPPTIKDAQIEDLLDLLKVPEYRTRYRARRELRGRNAEEVDLALKEWLSHQDESEPNYEHHLLEALWVSWGINKLNVNLLNRLIGSQDHRIRSACVRVIRYMHHLIANAEVMLLRTAEDDHGRVRLETIVTASWLHPRTGNNILSMAEKHPLDDWMKQSFAAAQAHLNGYALSTVEEKAITDLEGSELELFRLGEEIYKRDGYCSSCHQPDGKGLKTVGYPPLKDSEWVNGNEDRLIKLTIKGLMGPISVMGRNYNGNVPMTPYEGLMNDQEMAGVLTFIRNAFGNKSSAITPAKVKELRNSIKSKQGFYTAEELLNQHPWDE